VEIFELYNKIIQLSLDWHFWYFLSTGSQLIYKKFPKPQQVKHGRGTRKAIFQSVAVNIKKLSSKCNLTAQIEDKFRIKTMSLLIIEWPHFGNGDMRSIVLNRWPCFLCANIELQNTCCDCLECMEIYPDSALVNE
jgi:hypothetical protein